ncbi:MAG: sulfurtransferase [Actinomycetia bacterium]|nr:sulfurtransferase [Actinomycetes bacterium]
MSDEIVEVSPEEGHRRFRAGALLLDVREADEWEAGHAEGATWVPMTELGTREADIPTDREIVVICRSGARSARVTAALQASGRHAVNLGGGSLAWVAAGLPFVRDDGLPGNID